jgi:hypothetical protein
MIDLAHFQDLFFALYLVLSNCDKTTESARHKRKRKDCLSADGKWRSFPKVPNLLQYISS